MNYLDTYNLSSNPSRYGAPAPRINASFNEKEIFIKQLLVFVSNYPDIYIVNYERIISNNHYSMGYTLVFPCTNPMSSSPRIMETNTQIIPNSTVLRTMIYISTIPNLPIGVIANLNNKTENTLNYGLGSLQNSRWGNLKIYDFILKTKLKKGDICNTYIRDNPDGEVCNPIRLIL